VSVPSSELGLPTLSPAKCEGVPSDDWIKSLALCLLFCLSKIHNKYLKKVLSIDLDYRCVYPVMRKNQTCVIPVSNFWRRRPHDPVSTHEKLFSRSNTFLWFLKGWGPLKKFIKSAEMLTNMSLSIDTTHTPLLFHFTLLLNVKVLWKFCISFVKVFRIFASKMIILKQIFARWCEANFCSEANICFNLYLFSIKSNICMQICANILK
jgi:hypothetical protein